MQSISRTEDPGFKSRLRQDFSGSSYQWLKNWNSNGYPARRPALQGQRWDWFAWCQYIQWLGELESLIFNFYLSVEARKIVWADPPLRYASMLLGRQASKQPTSKQTLCKVLDTKWRYGGGRGWRCVCVCVRGEGGGGGERRWLSSNYSLGVYKEVYRTSTPPSTLTITMLHYRYCSVMTCQHCVRHRWRTHCFLPSQFLPVFVGNLDHNTIQSFTVLENIARVVPPLLQVVNRNIGCGGWSRSCSKQK